jgi:hypothetical protein
VVVTGKPRALSIVASKAASLMFQETVVAAPAAAV